MKFKTETEFCEHVTKLILGLLAGEDRQVICVPEVPRHYFSNELVDMMLLDIKNKEILCIEYKLGNPKKLIWQVRATQGRGLNCIGIINTEHQQQRSVFDGGIQNLFGYTGEDIQVESLAKYITYSYSTHWASVYAGRGMMYYWAYKNNQSRFDGGKPGGKRQLFASVYMQAIQNLHAEYGKLDFMLTHAALMCGYSVSVSKKYYRKAIKAPAASGQEKS